MSREGDWMCPACQYLNFKKRESCQRCSCPKYATGADLSSYTIQRPEKMPGDWYCGALNCGSHNYASRTSCYRCSASRDYACVAFGCDAIPGWKTGDWICARCEMHNYASRTECYKCKTPKG